MDRSAHPFAKGTAVKLRSVSLPATVGVPMHLVESMRAVEYTPNLKWTGARVVR